MTEVSLEERVRRLEHQNWRLMVGLLAVLAVVAGVVCVFAVLPGLRYSYHHGLAGMLVRTDRLTGRAWQMHGIEWVEVKPSSTVARHIRAAAAKTMRAQRFEVVDSAGAGWGIFRALPSGGVALGLRDKGGKAGITLAVDADGNPALGLFDKDGKGLWKAP